MSSRRTAGGKPAAYKKKKARGLASAIGRSASGATLLLAAALAEEAAAKTQASSQRNDSPEQSSQQIHDRAAVEARKQDPQKKDVPVEKKDASIDALNGALLAPDVAAADEQAGALSAEDQAALAALMDGDVAGNAPASTDADPIELNTAATDDVPLASTEPLQLSDSEAVDAALDTSSSAAPTPDAPVIYAQAGGATATDAGAAGGGTGVTGALGTALGAFGGAAVPLTAVVGAGAYGSATVDNDATPVPPPVAGRVIDGPVSGARVFHDKDGDGVWDNNNNGIFEAGEEAGAITDANGNYSFGTLPSGYTFSVGDKIVTLPGGTDVFTGKTVSTALAAVYDASGASNITPLTLLQTAGLTDAQILSALGITNPPPGFDLDSYDPYAAMQAGGADAAFAEQLFTAQAQIQTIIQAAAQVQGEGMGVTNIQGIVNAVAGAMAAGNGSTVSLSSIADIAIHTALDIPAGQPLSGLGTATLNATNAAVANIDTAFDGLGAGLRSGDPAAVLGAKNTLGLAQTVLLDNIEQAVDTGNVTDLNNVDDLFNNLNDPTPDITEAQAADLIEQGFHFDATDDVTLHAEGSHVSTSLKDLNSLGVDTIVVNADVATGANADIAIDLGTGAPLSTPHFAAEPGSNAADLVVQLDINDNQVADAAGIAATLHDVGIDLIGGTDGSLTLSADEASALLDASIYFAPDDQIVVALTDAQFADTDPNTDDALSRVTDFNDANIDSGIDIFDMLDNSASVTETQAAELVDAGIHFAAADDVSMQAEGSHLSTSLKDLADLGVDHVLPDAAATGGHDIVLDLGFDTGTTGIEQKLLSLLENFNGPVFNTQPGAVDVELDVADQAQFDAITQDADLVTHLVDLGVDFVKIVGTDTEQDLDPNHS